MIKSGLLLLTANDVGHCHFLFGLVHDGRQSLYKSIVAIDLFVAECGHGEGSELVEIQAGPHVFGAEGSQYPEEQGEEHVVPEDSGQFEGEFPDDFVLFGLTLPAGAVEPLPIDRHDNSYKY